MAPLPSTGRNDSVRGDPAQTWMFNFCPTIKKRTKDKRSKVDRWTMEKGRSLIHANVVYSESEQSAARHAGRRCIMRALVWVGLHMARTHAAPQRLGNISRQVNASLVLQNCASPAMTHRMPRMSCTGVGGWRGRGGGG